MKVAFSSKKPHKNSPIIFPRVSRMNPVLTHCFWKRLIVAFVGRRRRSSQTIFREDPFHPTHPSLALAMQEQEQAYTMLETIESDSEEDDAEIDDASSSTDDFRFLEDEEIGSSSSSSSSDQETDDLEVDELTYEELLALGEFTGEEKRGLPSSEISACLHPYTCELAVGQSKTSIDRCVVCQLEYDDGESLAALSCEHPYHWECISQWLQIKKSCPICCTQVSSPSSSSKTMIL